MFVKVFEFCNDGIAANKQMCIRFPFDNRKGFNYAGLKRLKKIVNVSKSIRIFGKNGI